MLIFHRHQNRLNDLTSIGSRVRLGPRLIWLQPSHHERSLLLASLGPLGRKKSNHVQDKGERVQEGDGQWACSLSHGQEDCSVKMSLPIELVSISDSWELAKFLNRRRGNCVTAFVVNLKLASRSLFVLPQIKDSQSEWTSRKPKSWAASSDHHLQELQPRGRKTDSSPRYWHKLRSDTNRRLQLLTWSRGRLGRG